MEIADEGGTSLESGDIDGVMESLDLFGEMLGFRKPPEMFQLPHGDFRGTLGRGSVGEMQFGPAVIYDDTHNCLKFVASTIDSRKNEVSTADRGRFRLVYPPRFFKELVPAGSPSVIFIADRALFVIILVVIFCRKKFRGRYDRRDNRFVEKTFF